jgi:hypothetical protein
MPSDVAETKEEQQIGEWKSLGLEINIKAIKR